MKKSKYTPTTKNKYKMGDILLVSISTYSVPNKPWVGQIVGIMNRCYSIEVLFPLPTNSLVRIPFILDYNLQKISKKSYKKVLNSLKVLYYLK